MRAPIAILVCAVLTLGACSAESAVDRPSTSLPPVTTATVATTTTTLPGSMPVSVESRVSFTDLLVLDVVAPVDPGPWPVVVLVHGGGWLGGERADVADLAIDLSGQGSVVYNTAYRTMVLGGTYPEPFEDIACSVRFARATAAEHGGDPQQVILIGYSAGGHLASVVALAGDDFEGDCAVDEGSALPDAFIGISGPYDSDQFSPLLIPLFGGTLDSAADAWKAGNPFTHIDRRTDLPVRLLQAGNDQLVDPELAVQFFDALLAAGYDVTLEIIEGAEHGEMVQPGVYGRRVADLVADLSGG